MPKDKPPSSFIASSKQNELSLLSKVTAQEIFHKALVPKETSALSVGCQSIPLDLIGHS